MQNNSAQLVSTNVFPIAITNKQDTSNKSKEEMDTHSANQRSQTIQHSSDSIQLMVRLEKNQIYDWLQDLNDTLRQVGSTTMTDGRMDSFADKLYANSYTLEEAAVAHKFIVFGKKVDFRTKEILPSYFYPTREDMSVFTLDFIQITDHQAKLREQQRQHDTEIERLQHEIEQKVKSCRGLQHEVARLTREPPISNIRTEEESKQIDVSKLYIEAQTNWIDATQKIKKLEEKAAKFMRRIEILETKLRT